MVMHVKIDVFGNWIKGWTCGDYRSINKWTWTNKYVVSMPKEIFDVIGHTKMFSTLDLQFEYHQLPVHEGDKVKITFWGIDQNGMNYFV